MTLLIAAQSGQMILNSSSGGTIVVGLFLLAASIQVSGNCGYLDGFCPKSLISMAKPAAAFRRSIGRDLGEFFFQVAQEVEPFFHLRNRDVQSELVQLCRSGLAGKSDEGANKPAGGKKHHSGFHVYSRDCLVVSCLCVRRWNPFPDCTLFSLRKSSSASCFRPAFVDLALTSQRPVARRARAYRHRGMEKADADIGIMSMPAFVSVCGTVGSMVSSPVHGACRDSGARPAS